jgi:hypothetical protein
MCTRANPDRPHPCHTYLTPLLIREITFCESPFRKAVAALDPAHLQLSMMLSPTYDPTHLLKQ